MSPTDRGPAAEHVEASRGRGVPTEVRRGRPPEPDDRGGEGTQRRRTQRDPLQLHAVRWSSTDVTGASPQPCPSTTGRWAATPVATAPTCARLSSPVRETTVWWSPSRRPAALRATRSPPAVHRWRPRPGPPRQVSRWGPLCHRPTGPPRPAPRRAPGRAPDHRRGDVHVDDPGHVLVGVLAGADCAAARGSAGDAATQFVGRGSVACGAADATHHP